MAGWCSGVLQLATYRTLWVETPDGLSVPILFTIALLCTLISIYSMPYMNHIIGEDKRQFGLYYALLLLYSVGMMGAVLATNLIEFYLFFELMLVPSYFLIAKWGYGERDRISFMYFMWTHIGALAFFVRILSIGYLSGSFDLATIMTQTIPANLRALIVILMVAGLLVKMAAFGLHISAAKYSRGSAHTDQCLTVTGDDRDRRLRRHRPPRNVNPARAAFFAISTVLTVWAVVTMFYGGLMALVQDDIKRLLAYSSISQMGYILLGISSVQTLGVSGAMFQYVTHGLGKGILFMMAGAIILQAHGLRSISKMGGLASKMPITATAALLGFLTIMGIPPTTGFFSEFLIFAGSFKEAFALNSMLRFAMSFLGVVSTAITAGYCLWAVKRIFFGKLPDELSNVTEAPATVLGPMIVLAVISLILGIFPDLVERLLLPAVKMIVGG